MTGNQNSRLRHPSTWLLPILLIALAALVLPSVTHGQGTASTPVTLVSNQGQAGDASATYDKDHGQAFTTRQRNKRLHRHQRHHQIRGPERRPHTAADLQS